MMTHPTVVMALAQGFTFDQVTKAIDVVGDDPNDVISYLFGF